MLFAGRPELPLPSAPDTRSVDALRWIIVCLVSTIITQAILFVSVVGSEPRLFQSVSPLIPIIVLPVLLLVVVLVFYCNARDRAERSYWTPERLREQYPALWHLYCAGNRVTPDPASSAPGASR